MNSRIGNLARRRPEFGSGKAKIDAAQLEYVERYRWMQIQRLPDAIKNPFLSSFVYIPKVIEKFVFRLIGYAAHLPLSLAPCACTMGVRSKEKMSGASLLHSQIFNDFGYKIFLQVKQGKVYPSGKCYGSVV